MSIVIIPNRLKIIVDTREQLPYKFNNYSVEIISQKLDTGDYSLFGLEDYISIERKMRNDFLLSITHDRERFFKELERMTSFKHRFIVVESSLDNTYNHVKNNTRIYPNSFNGTIARMGISYGVPIYFTKDRRYAEDLTYRLLYLAHKDYLGQLELLRWIQDWFIFLRFIIFMVGVKMKKPLRSITANNILY